MSVKLFQVLQWHSKAWEAAGLRRMWSMARIVEEAQCHACSAIALVFLMIHTRQRCSGL